MPRTNPQSRSVGNLGDILKHAALFELASLLAELHAPVRYIETHTYLLDAPPADLGRWRREVDGLVSKNPANAGYVALEAAALARTGRYRCSAGLVMDVLRDRRVFATLGEADAKTRAELREQTALQQLANVVIVDDATAALRDGTSPHADSVLVHVDPFALSPELWARLAPGLDATCESAAAAVLVAYRYTRSGRSPWPAAPAATLGPVAQIRGGPHEVAVYASAGVADRVREICAALGWVSEPL